MYTFVNPRTRKSVIISSLEDEEYTYPLYENKKDDILIVYSSQSCTIKGFKWHFEEYGGDIEGPEQVWEVNLPSLLGCLHTQINVITANDLTIKAS